MTYADKVREQLEMNINMALLDGYKWFSYKAVGGVWHRTLRRPGRHTTQFVSSKELNEPIAYSDVVWSIPSYSTVLVTARRVFYDLTKKQKCGIIKKVGLECNDPMMLCEAIVETVGEKNGEPVA